MLHCFEAMSGLKINYQKKWSFLSRDYYWRTKERVADLFNYNKGTFLMKYLGIMPDRWYMSSDFAYVYEKIGKRVRTKQSCLLSYGGKMIFN